MTRTPPAALAVILARAGSKGLPRKNTLAVAGKPCALWTIDAALASRSIGRIALSTDDRDLVALARAHHPRSVEIVERPADLASDSATIDAAARHALTALNHNPSAPVVVLYANVPVRPPGLIDRALDELARADADSVQSYAPVGKFHPWWMVRIDQSHDANAVRPWQGDVLNHGVFRRQDLPPAFVPDGGIIALRTQALTLSIPNVHPGPHAFLGRADRRAAVINAEGDVIDIDSRTDLLVADAILRERERDSATVPQSPTTPSQPNPTAGAARC
ncbi:MAG: acylneuraminate cytidylyltransferase family protein [Phycisphaeraceae bacterium]|nr:acylneuraminate cytidylyltransferase family protein [Phycisphaeraceae bacterium]